MPLFFVQHSLCKEVTGHSRDQRGIRRSPAAVASLAVAVGVGASTFTVSHHLEVLLSPCSPLLWQFAPAATFQVVPLRNRTVHGYSLSTLDLLFSKKPSQVAYTELSVLDVKDSLALELLKWLKRQRPWTRNSGKDHVFVLGKISWDFRRTRDSSWGTRLLELDKMQNPIKLLIKRQPWHVNDIGIPHPTFFHPHSDNNIIAWQLKIIKSNPKNLVSFAGAARPDAEDNIRSILIEQCRSNGDVKCQFPICSSGKCDAAESVIELFVESEFCLQPPGDSPTRKSVFDSLVSGCIPVLFDPLTAYYQYPWHLPEDHEDYSVFIDQKEVKEMNMNVMDMLANVSARERENKRRYIVYELLPGVAYGDANPELDRFQDASAISMNDLLERVNRLG